MLFSSITFLYYFLPITMFVYVLVPKNWRNAILFLASFLFYFWGEPKYCLLMLLSILAGYVGGLVIYYTREKEARFRKMVLAITVFIPLSFLAIFKYADWIFQSINTTFGSQIPLLRVALPIGISFYTFQIISYLVDVYRGDTPVEKNFIHMGAYVVMFPQLIAGPIVRFSTIQQELQERSLSFAQSAQGMERFILGLAKKVLIADLLGEFVIAMDATKGESAWFLWVTAFAYAMQIYFDFSGYSDMAIGLGRMLGFHFPENFDHPYCSKSITEFWRRWHMTLGGWFRDYVYIPLGGSRVSRIKWARNTFCVWALSGLWHGASFNFVLWGLYFGVLLVLEKLFLKRILERLPSLLQHFYAILLIVISFVIFRLENLNQLLWYLAGMFGFVQSTGTNQELLSLGYYQIRNYAVILLGAFFIATGIPKHMLWEKLPDALKAMGYVVLLIIITGFLLQSSVHPFLYFRF